MNREIKYQKCFIAYLDILGFKEMVKQSEDNPDKIKSLLDSLIICNSFSLKSKKATTQGTPRTINIKSRFISDSIVFFLKENPEDIGHLFLIIRYIQDRLWDKGLLIRGAITHDDMYFPKGGNGNNITLGPGIIKAYQLESTVAIYPRIVVSEILFDYIKRYKIGAYPFATGNTLADFVQQDHDGIYFLDLLNKNIIRADGEKLEKEGDTFSIVWETDAPSKHKEIMSCVERCINSFIKQNDNDEKTQQKYNWLKYYKESIQ